jgi:hypothetical protein
MQYITVADIDAALGAAWAAEADKARFVAMANAYLSAQSLRPIDPLDVPQAIVDAGVELAAVAAAGELYQQKVEGEVTSKSVKAGSVATSKTYASVAGTARALPARLQYALALLDPWVARSMSFDVWR